MGFVISAVGGWMLSERPVVDSSSLYSVVVVKMQQLQWLGLRSLKEVSAGKVLLKNNVRLCYTQTVQWSRLFKSADQKMINNDPPDVCGES